MLVETTPAQARAVRASVATLERYIRGPVTLAVLRRYAFWHALQQTLPGAAATLAAEHREQDELAQRFAALLRGLDAGTLQVLPWREATEGPAVLRLGVVPAGAIGAGTLGFPILAVIAVGAAAVGAWVLLDAWLAARKLEANTDALRAKTQAEVTRAVTQLSATDPMGARQLANALTAANRAAANVQPGILERIGETVDKITETVSDNSSWLLALAAVWLFGRRRHA